MHRLEALVDLLEANGKLLPEDLANLGHLTPFATAFRYEDLPLTAPFDRTEALGCVRRLRAFVESQIGPPAT